MKKVAIAGLVLLALFGSCYLQALATPDVPPNERDRWWCENIGKPGSHQDEDGNWDGTTAEYQHHYGWEIDLGKWVCSRYWLVPGLIQRW